MSNNNENLVLVSTSGNSAVLRSSSDYRYRVVGLPTPVLVVPAYVEYLIEYPTVEVTAPDGTSRDVSEFVSCNHPNPETPGLYELYFMLNMPGEAPIKVWASWVSIEEPPLLRGVVSPWMRENRTMSDLNRLVLEPQFQEALYAARSPMYNFMGSNANAAISASALPSLRTIQAYSLEKELFVSGTMLPAGTTIRSGSSEYIIKITKLAPEFSPGQQYYQYNVVSYAGGYWMALEDTYTIPSDDAWLKGYSYDVGGDALGPTGNLQLDSVSVMVDSGGYLFKVDALAGITLGHYWGVYDPEHFYDYAPGDLVSLISEGVHYLYRRNDTDTSQKEIELSYRPGNYRNPHWDEVYCATSQGALRTPVVEPITNATNTLVAKTGSVRDDVFRIYARLAGIPMPLVDSLGLKKGVLIWAILYRTRNTFFGFKVALQALGIKLDYLQRVHPSMEYYADGSDTPIADVYDEIECCKEMAKSIKANRLLANDADPPDPLPDDADTLPYITYKDDGVTVEKFVPGTGWTELYRFKKLSGDFSPAEWDFSKNNRYYRALVGFMDRLSGDNLIDMGDEFEWLSDEAFAPLSLQLDLLFNYEIPIYIYLRMFVRLASVGTMTRLGVIGGVVYHEAYGGDILLRVYPTKVFDIESLQAKSYWPVVSYSDTPNGEYTTASYDMEVLAPFHLYRFDHNVYIRFSMQEGFYITRYWISPNSIGRIIDESTQLYLCNGEVGITVEVSNTSNISVGVEAYVWNYIFGNDGSPWDTDEVEYEIPFAGYREIPCTFISAWNGTAIEFVNYIDRLTSPQGIVHYETDADGNIVPIEITDEMVATEIEITDEMVATENDVDYNIETSGSDILIALVGEELHISGVAPKVLYMWHGEQIVGTLYINDMPPMTTPENGSYSMRLTFSDT